MAQETCSIISKHSDFIINNSVLLKCEESNFLSFHVVKAYWTQATLSPEVTSKAASNEEVSTPKKKNKDEFTNVKALTDKLAEALLNISAKEDLSKAASNEEQVFFIAIENVSILIWYY